MIILDLLYDLVSYNIIILTGIMVLFAAVGLIILIKMLIELVK